MDIKDITHVGPKTEKLLNKLDIYTLGDLLNYYPYRYNYYSFNNLYDKNDTLIIDGIIESNPAVYFIKRNFNKLSFRVNVDNKIINVVIFNRAFLKPNLVIAKRITLLGKYDISKNTFTASDIKFNINNGDIEPIYHLTSGITNNNISKLILSNINHSVPDLIPENYIIKYNFLSKNESLIKIHNPHNAEDIKKSKIRLIYEELFNFCFKMNYLTRINKNEKGVKKIFDNNKIIDLINSLPYKLTDDQLNSVKEILNDLKSDKKMNRILLGDVGSGKTVVSSIGIYASFLSGYQSALMAPTEILANQHYKTISKMFKDFNLQVALITGSTTKKEKQIIYDKVKKNEIDLLIGTHAILSDNIVFNKIGLVITDEQHRFGVNQRSVLQNKSEKIDVLYLSATPIPRTYALTIYGDLDISYIKTKPIGRKEIITKVEKESNIKEVLLKILEEIKNNHQVYIVCPLVEQNEENELNSVNELKEKIDISFKHLIKSEIIHGKMKQKDKDIIMEDFKLNKIKILISTTVIEVGVDVSNATMIIIYNAERFGLATLHQLRGRVGRSDLQSYCYLISDYDKERLKVMEESNDGFYISQKDFELRGHGDLFGTRQHGDMHFKIANLKNDYEILVQAKNDSLEYINNSMFLDNDYYKKMAEDLDIVD